MESRPLQNNETEITDNYIHREEKGDDREGRFLSREELEENQKVQEMLSKFLNAKSPNKSELRKSLFNIAASLMKLLAILEDTPNQETTVCRAKTRENHGCDENDKFSSKDQNIPRKINRHLGQKNDGKNEKISRVAIKRVSSNNEPVCVGYIDKSLYENEECSINMQKPDSGSSQYIPLLQEYATQKILQKNENCNSQLNNETEIVFECKNVEPTITLLALQKSEYMSENQFQDSEISVPTRAAIKNERLDMVKKEYLDDSMEKLNLNNNIETNGLSEIIPPLNSIHDGGESEMFETCSKKLEKNSNLKIHMDTARNHISHSCNICGKKFTQKSKLEIHTEVLHSGRKLYQCDACGKTFARKDKLVHHMDSIHIDLACHASRKTIAQKDYLIKHIDSVHNGKKSYNRGTDGKALRQKVALKKHIDKARRSITHTCDTCGKTFKHKSSLKNHIDFVHKNLKHHKCDRCQKTFSAKGGLNLHMSTAHNGITHTCDICEKKFTQKSHLMVHINIVHMGNRKLFKCEECQKSFDYKCHLTYHIEYAHKGITHPCNLCEKIFTSKMGLHYHKNSVHKGIFYPCDLCEKVFTSKRGLDYHKDSVHKGITYPCDLCRKVFTRKDKLKEHKDSVHNCITHPCNQCEKSFTKKSNLKLHINEVHNGKK